MTRSDLRFCARCGARLARDNTASLCSPCIHARRTGRDGAPQVSVAFWRTGEMPRALASRDMGAVVRAYRGHPAHGRVPLPQADVARWLGITQGQLSRIEAGRNRVRDLDKLVHYARRLNIPAELLWFDLGDASAERDVSSAGRPHGLETSGPAGIEAGAETTMADRFLLTLRQYIATDNLIGPRHVLPIAREHAGLVERLLAESRDRARGDLLYVAARFAEFTGWLHQDIGDLRTAGRWSNAALDFALEVGDVRLISYVNMRKSQIASDSYDAELAITFAQAALREASALTPRLKAVALLQEAHGHALAGHPEDCARALDLAYQSAVEAEKDDDDDDLARYCTPNYVTMEAARCWSELGRPDRGLATLQPGVADWSPDFRRDLGLGFARLAAAHAGVGEPDDALTAARSALSIVAQTQSQRTVRQLRGASDALAAVGADEHARHLRHLLTTSGT